MVCSGIAKLHTVSYGRELAAQFATSIYNRDNGKIQLFLGPAGWLATHLDSVVTYIDFLGIVWTAIAWSICNAIAKKFAQYGIR